MGNCDFQYQKFQLFITLSIFKVFQQNFARLLQKLFSIISCKFCLNRLRCSYCMTKHRVAVFFLGHVQYAYSVGLIIYLVNCHCMSQHGASFFVVEWHNDKFCNYVFLQTGKAELHVQTVMLRRHDFGRKCSCGERWVCPRAIDFLTYGSGVPVMCVLYLELETVLFHELLQVGASHSAVPSCRSVGLLSTW